MFTGFLPDATWAAVKPREGHCKAKEDNQEQRSENNQPPGTPVTPGTHGIFWTQSTQSTQSTQVIEKKVSLTNQSLPGSTGLQDSHQKSEVAAHAKVLEPR